MDSAETAAIAPGDRTGYASQSEKWGHALDAGYQIVPNVLIRAQSKLNLDAVDLVLLLNMNLHWWRKEECPYPQPSIIAKRMGVSKRTIERRIEKLVNAGLLQRVPRPDNPRRRGYRLDGLVTRLEQAAATGLQQREYFRSNSKGGEREH